MPARISRIFPENEVINVKAGEDVTIDCYATGSPVPYIKIRSTEDLPPGNLEERILLEYRNFGLLQRLAICLFSQPAHDVRTTL